MDVRMDTVVLVIGGVVILEVAKLLTSTVYRKLTKKDTEHVTKKECEMTRKLCDMGCAAHKQEIGRDFEDLHKELCTYNHRSSAMVGLLVEIARKNNVDDEKITALIQ